MMRRTCWQKIAARQLAPAKYGRTQQAWRHRDGHALLLLHRPRSRNGQWNRRVGYWCLVHDDVLVRRKPAYGRRVRGVPWRWAGRTLRAYTTGSNGQACHLLNGRRPTVAESIITLPPLYDELPPVLARHHTHRNVTADRAGADDDPPMPVALPLVPPMRTLKGKYARLVLCREEYELYADLWRQWAEHHPEYTTSDLHDLCMGEVLLHRIMLVMGWSHDPALYGLYHKTHLRLQRVRLALGATRRQRLAPGGGAVPNIALWAGQVQRRHPTPVGA